MVNIGMTSRDVARELARRYSTMTHEELDLLEGILVPMKFPKGEKVISEGEVCTHMYWVVKGLVRQYYYKNNKELTEHMKSHKKDFHTRRGLLMLVGRRRRLLSYIKKNDIVEYRELIKALGIRDNIQ